MEIIANQDNLHNFNKDSVIHFTKEKTTVASQTSPLKGTQPQYYVVTTEQPRKPNRERTSIVPQLLQGLLYRYPKYRTACEDYA